MITPVYRGLYIRVAYILILNSVIMCSSNYLIPRKQTVTIKQILFLTLIGFCAVLPVAAGDFQAFDIGSAGASERILVVMEKTEFKLAVLQGVADSFEGQDIGFHVEPFQIYSEINEDDWSAILIMAPVYSDKVAAPTAEFINGLKNKDKVFLLATSGDSEFQLPSDAVDSLTSVSLKSSQSTNLTKQIVAELSRRL